MVLDIVMTIDEQLKIINENFEELHGEYLSLVNEKLVAEKKYHEQKNAVIEKYQFQINESNSVKENLLLFYKAIQNYTHEVIVNNYKKKQSPKFSELHLMLQKIDHYNINDPVACTIANQMVDLINSNLSYMDDKLIDIKDCQIKEMSLIGKDREKALALLLERKKNLFKKVECYVSGDDVKNLNNLLDDICKNYEITNEYFVSWDKTGSSQKKMTTMVLGSKQMLIPVPKFACGKMKDSLGGKFDVNTKNVNCPVVFSTDSFEEITIEYTDKNESEMKNGIQVLILNFLRSFNVNFKVSLLDSIYYNANLLGPLADFAKGKNSLIDKVAQDESGLSRAVSILAAYYRNVESKIGVQTVYQYNSKCKANESVPLRLLIINKKEERFHLSQGDDMSYIVNNAEKFGITIIKLLKKSDESDKERSMLHSSYAEDTHREKIISDSDGNFYIENGKCWLRFAWLSYSGIIPYSFIEKIQKLLQPPDNGTKYFKRYEMHLPEKSTGERKPIILPFAVDDDDNVISCSFENENFAAYIMGVSGSGKSTLLHTLVTGMLMNYHPDELELWLLDFKMTEFKRYVDNCPPHIRYILLENSEDLVFDIIDKLTELLESRKRLFAAQKPAWKKLEDVPLDRNMPAVFVIIDEFTRMSQIIQETKGSGRAGDYTLKLENLLREGRALGLKFIFASQTYSTGVAGLKYEAKEQIQMRFAMKNTKDEIKQTLNLTSCDDEISNYIKSLSDTPYETLFKWRDESGSIKIGKYRNMYTEDGEIETLINKINAGMKPLTEGSVTDNSSYINKDPVLIDGSRSKTFESQITYYNDFEAKGEYDFVDAGDIFIYPGVPCSFNLAKPFVLCSGTAENILLTGGGREEKISVLLSILKSCKKVGKDVEIWAHEKSAASRKYKDCFYKDKQIYDLSKICHRISEIKSEIKSGKQISPGLIVCMGYELMMADFEIFGEDLCQSFHNKNDFPSLSEILKKVKVCSDPEEKKRMIKEYNKLIDSNNARTDKTSSLKSCCDLRTDMEWIIKRAPAFGLHFLFYFERVVDFISLNIQPQIFRHKILFSMSREESNNILGIGNKKASEIERGVFLYTNGKEICSMRPHISKGIPLNGYIIDDKGLVKQQEI